MLEFAVRLFAAGLLFLVSSWIGTPDPAVAWKLSAAIAAYACLGYWLETSGRSNAGIKGALATADSGAIAFIAASAHALDQNGLLGDLARSLRSPPNPHEYLVHGDGCGWPRPCCSRDVQRHRSDACSLRSFGRHFLLLRRLQSVTVQSLCRSRPSYKK